MLQNDLCSACWQGRRLVSCDHLCQYRLHRWSGGFGVSLVATRLVLHEAFCQRVCDQQVGAAREAADRIARGRGWAGHVV